MGHELPGLVWGWKEAAPEPSQAARLGQLCSAPRPLRRARSTLPVSHEGPLVGFVSAPVPWLCRCSALDVLQQAGHCLGQDLLQLLPLPSAERRQDVVGHCHSPLWPPDANPEPGHLLGRKEESWGSFPSSVQTELGRVTVLRARLGSKETAPHVFQVVLSACSKKHNFGGGFCWAVRRSQAAARPGRDTQANCFHVLHGGQTDNSPLGRRGRRKGGKGSRGLSEKNGSGGTSHALRGVQD